MATYVALLYQKQLSKGQMNCLGKSCLLHNCIR